MDNRFEIPNKREAIGKKEKISLLVAGAVTIVCGIIFIYTVMMEESGADLNPIIIISPLISMAISLVYLLMFFGAYMSKSKVNPPHQDALKYTSFDEFKYAAATHFGRMGLDVNPGFKALLPPNVTIFNDYYNPNMPYLKKENNLVAIIEMDEFTSESSKDIDKVLSFVRDFCNPKIPLHKLVILNVRNINIEFINFMSRFTVITPYYGDLEVTFVSAISFNERSIFIQKRLEGGGMIGYNKMLSSFCQLMMVETPSFKKKKKDKQF